MPKLPPVKAGEVYNGIEVIGNVASEKSKNGKKHNFCDVRCHCGNTFRLRTSDLKRGKTLGCGCRRGSHKLSKHPLYTVWSDMNARCDNPNEPAYKNYGAKGIKVCPEWHKDNPEGLQNFIDDMYSNYKEGYQLDKDIRAIPNQPKCYSKDTCCWVLPLKNRRANSLTKLNIAQVKEIKHRLSTGVETSRAIAKDYPVSENAISSIKLGRTWKDITI